MDRTLSAMVLFVDPLIAQVFGGPVGLSTHATAVAATGLVRAFAALRAPLGLCAVLVALIAVAFCALGRIADLGD